MVPVPQHILITNKRLTRGGYYRWQRPKAKPVVFTRADDAGTIYPAFTNPSNYQLVENWNKTDNVWKHGGFDVKAVDQPPLTEWQVVDGGTGIIAAVSLPEWSSSVGLPAALFISVGLSHPSAANGIDAKGAWALKMDVAQLLEDAIITPLASRVGPNGVAFAAYIFGVIKSVAPVPPVLRLAIDAFWTSDGYTTYSGDFYSNVAANAPGVLDGPPAGKIVENPSEKFCCKCHTDDGWVQAENTKNPWSAYNVYFQAQVQY